MGGREWGGNTRTDDEQEEGGMDKAKVHLAQTQTARLKIGMADDEADSRCLHRVAILSVRRGTSPARSFMKRDGVSALRRLRLNLADQAFLVFITNCFIYYF